MQQNASVARAHAADGPIRSCGFLYVSQIIFLYKAHRGQEKQETACFTAVFAHETARGSGAATPFVLGSRHDRRRAARDACGTTFENGGRTRASPRREFKAEPAGKPGSVVDSHSSRPAVASRLKQPTRERRGPRHAPLFGLAPGGVCLATRRCPRARCALTAPFQPYLIPCGPSAVCFLLH